MTLAPYLSRRALPFWPLFAGVLALLILAPVVSVVWLAFHPTENIWPHLLSTVLPRYLLNTLRLMLGVTVLAVVAGTGAAWLVTVHRFPGSRWLDLALFFPLAVPAYVGAYALVDILDYPGLVQSWLRQAMGWQSARDYWFPDVRNAWGASLVLGGALYPYVYLLARAAFREQSGTIHDVARALGAGPYRLFWSVGLPLARPAIAAGVALALMEVLADYGTVQHFGVQTLTTGIFTTWLTAGNAGGAAQIALVVLVMVSGLMWVERAGRAQARHHGLSRADRPIRPIPLAGWRGGFAFLFCFLPFAGGFLLPVAVMLYYAWAAPSGWLSPDLGRALAHTLLVASLAALVTVALALVVVFGLRSARGRWAGRLSALTALGYATPGAVLALGLLIPLASLDHHLADLVSVVTGRDPGLVLTGTATALILAYVVRFFGVAQGGIAAGMGRVAPSLPMAARMLGRGQGGALFGVYLPIMRGTLATALVMVFVDSVKELPATLLLRPFNFNTLATRVFEQASLERLHDAAPAALLVMAVGLCAVVLLIRGDHR
ncbi:ABC transporter permease [Neogemmobacter tilapiae]|uniref:Iron ABC transporter permease n=1 Tax=Neogemmobacter tilapiae TaxID=875041 RepID=A0A918WJL7_9RHOB|nr:iron ABC transporter permease [Gemmobacter tilapiae]GHC57722.1 iron ABC transporter permease [Gemmobacter tilapiae]